MRKEDRWRWERCRDKVGVVLKSLKRCVRARKFILWNTSPHSQRLETKTTIGDGLHASYFDGSSTSQVWIGAKNGGRITVLTWWRLVQVVSLAETWTFGGRCRCRYWCWENLASCTTPRNNGHGDRRKVWVCRNWVNWILIRPHLFARTHFKN